MLTIQDIKQKKFEKSAFGYKMDDVERFLNEVIDLVAELQEENNEAQKKLVVLAGKIEEYRSEEDSLRQALLGAQKLGDSILKEAKNRAEIMMRDATIKSEQIIKNVKDDVKREEVILNKMKREVDSFRSKMLTMYSTHIDMIKSIPEVEHKEEIIKEEPAIEVKVAEPVIEKTEPVEAAPVVEEKKKVIEAVEEKPAFVIENAVEEKTEAPAEKNEEAEISGGFQFVRYEDNSGDFKFQKESKGESKFGKLKFGDDYDITGDKK